MLNPLYAFICQKKNNVIVGNFKQKGICNAKYPKETHITNSLFITFMRQNTKFQHIIEIIQQVHCLTQNGGWNLHKNGQSKGMQLNYSMDTTKYILNRKCCIDSYTPGPPGKQSYTPYYTVENKWKHVLFFYQIF